MTHPTKFDYLDALAAVENGQLLTTHQISTIVAALRGAVGPNATATATGTGSSFAMLQRAADIPEAAPAKPEISLFPALLAKTEEGNELLREIRDMMRCKNPKLALATTKETREIAQ